MIFAWVQKGADGSVCKLWHHCTQTEHKPELYNDNVTTACLCL